MDPTRLIYLIHRYYDPQTGQFISVDPMVSTTQAAYRYGADNPVSISDPSGALGKPAYCGTSAFLGVCLPTYQAVPGSAWQQVEGAMRVAFGGFGHTFWTPDGDRRVDVYVNPGVIIEVKIGYQGGRRLAEEARKDHYLMQVHGPHPYVLSGGAIWYWFPNAASATGPRPSLVNTLRQDGVFSIVYYNPRPDGGQVAPSRQAACAKSLAEAGISVILAAGAADYVAALLGAGGLVLA